MAPERALLLLLLLVSALLLAEAAKWRCEMHEDCGLSGECDTQRRCCVVRGCPSACPRRQVCAEGRADFGKFTKLIDPCTRPKKLGCVWEPEDREPMAREQVEWLDLFYDVQ